jgi:AraC family transcriptional activator of pobA
MVFTSAVPRFFLYGDPGREVEPDFLHIETIEARSRGLAWDIGMHSHADLAQILVLAEGDGEMRAEGERWTFRAPCLLLMPARVVHGFRFRPDTVGHVVTVAERLLSELTAAEPAAGAAMRAPACLALTAEEAASHELAAICAALALEFVWRAPARALAVRGHLLRLLAAAARLAAAREAPPPLPADRDAELVARFRELLERHFRDQWRLAAYAGRLGVTEARLTTACRRRLGRAPAALVQDRLALEAKRALLYTTHSVTEIAFALGFRDPAYFSRFFRRHAGVAAGAFRAAGQGTARRPGVLENVTARSVSAKDAACATVQAAAASPPEPVATEGARGAAAPTATA